MGRMLNLKPITKDWQRDTSKHCRESSRPLSSKAPVAKPTHCRKLNSHRIYSNPSLDSEMSDKPNIAITMGDPAGIGPEICLRALLAAEVDQTCVPIVFGDVDVLRKCSDLLGIPFEAAVAPMTPDAPKHALERIKNRPKDPLVLDIKTKMGADWTPGSVNAETGRASYTYIQRAIDAALEGHVDAVTTAPIHKEALSMAGIPYPGHTEMFAARSHSTRWCMMQYSEIITCTFVTVHVGYAEVVSHLTTERILEVIELSAEGLERIRGQRPRIAVCGLNPHAGEHGLFGNREEEEIILPAIRKAQEKGIKVEGPLPPDTAFLPGKRKTCDVIVCMYHDQGHIPVKALAFDSAVNTTLGLPIIRTSVDHGTALDIAWKGLANESSLISAIGLATRLAGSGSTSPKHY